MSGATRSMVRLPPPLAPPHKGEGKLPHAKSPSPLWGGVRGGGAGLLSSCASGSPHETGTG
jgi:hypothetical protein